MWSYTKRESRFDTDDYANLTWGGLGMLRTIMIGSCVSIQGIFLRCLPDGRIAIRVDTREYLGRPVDMAA